MRRFMGHAVLVCVGLGLGVLVWRGVPARAEKPAQDRAAVRMLPPGERLGANPGEKGATYYALAGRARRVTTRFSQAVVVTEPGADGDIHASVRDSAGREIGHLMINHVGAASDVLQFTTDAGNRFQALGEPGVKMTLDWASRQAYSLATDGVDAAQPDVEWRGGFVRRRGAPARDFEREIVALEMEWDDGLTAVTSRRPAARRKVLGNREFTGDVVVTRLTKDGQQVGLTNWYPREQAFTWNLPGLTRGSITAKQLADYGGWVFTPDLEWMNVQAIAFHHFKTTIDQHRFVAREGPGRLERLVNAVMPVLEANEPGCDGLHWLDDTIFRYCCDVHDGCYSKNGCSSRSWWQVWSSWRCTACNAWVVDCFAEGGVPMLMMA